MVYVLEKKKFSKRKLVPIFFLGFPLLAGLIISSYYEYLIDFKKLMAFITFSSWFFSFFSILLIFIVWEKFKESVFRKNLRDRKYLDMEGIEDLNSSVSIVLSVVDGKKDIDQLSENCRGIKYIYGKLKIQKQDTELYALKYELENVVDVVNRFNLESIGRNLDSEKWEKIKDDDKEVIGRKLYTLEQDLKALLKDLR